MSLLGITNPVHPFQASDWGIQDSVGPFYAGQGCGLSHQTRTSWFVFSTVSLAARA